MKKRETFMLSALTFSAGIIIGFLLSPIKNGIVNEAGNTTHNHYHEKKPVDSKSETEANE